MKDKEAMLNKQESERDSQQLFVRCFIDKLILRL
jgi:hypothetical protein